MHLKYLFGVIMRLNMQSDYALRMLMYLAVNAQRACTIEEIATRYGISRNHLMKVSQALGCIGLVKATRGRSGGLRLATGAASTSLGDVVRRVEADFALVECFAGRSGACLVTPACRLKGVLAEALDAFLAVLDRYTIEDLVAANPRLQTLLSHETA